MYKDSSCRSSPQPPPTTTNVAELASEPAVVVTTIASSITAVTTASSSSLAAGVSVDNVDTHVRTSAIENDEEDGFSCPSESSSDTEYEVRSRPSTTSTTSTSSSSAAAATPAVGAPCLRRQKRTTSSSAPRSHINSDVRLLRKIGYIASRVRFLAKIYGDFKLVNPYSPAKQKRLLQEILLKHSIVDPERELQKAENLKLRSAGSSSVRSLTPASSLAGSYCGLPQTESSFEDDSVTGTVRRKSSTSATTTASTFLLEDLLIQLYEDRRNKVTVIRRRRSRRSSAGAVVGGSKLPRNHLIIMSSKTTSSSVERLLQLDNEDEGGGGGGVIGVTGSESSDRLTKGNHIYNANITTSSQANQQRSSTAFLQPTPGDEHLKRRRASDCTPSHPGQALSNQLSITLKNNNCTKLLHRGSCGAAGEHLLAANSIANRQTLILSKSCGNVDAGLSNSNAALYGSSDLRNLSAGGGVGGGGTGGGGGNGSVTTITNSAAGGGGGGSAAAHTNGNNEYSIVQLNNTIIQCHFNDEDFRALVKDLKRKVEYTERMNWLCKYRF